MSQDFPRFHAPSKTNAGCLERQASQEAHNSLKASRANHHYAADRQMQGWHSVVTTVVPSEQVFNYILALPVEQKLPKVLLSVDYKNQALLQASKACSTSKRISKQTKII